MGTVGWRRVERRRRERRSEGGRGEVGSLYMVLHQWWIWTSTQFRLDVGYGKSMLAAWTATDSFMGEREGCGI